MSDGGKKRKSTSSYFHLAAGLASGVTSALLLQPADLLKTRVQQSPTSSLRATITAIAAGPKPLAHLWRGTLPSTIRTGAGSAIYFAGLNKLRHGVLAFKTRTSATDTAITASSSSLPKLSGPENLACGAIARASAGFIMMPVTVLKVRAESSVFGYHALSLSAAARSIATREGVRGFFAGAGATALRDAPAAGLYVLFYEWGKSALGGLASAGPLADGAAGMAPGASAAVNFVSGAGAACAATAATNPPDAVKTRLQLMPGRYRNSVQAVRLMVGEEGWRSLFDGLGLRMARKAMSSALAWTVYEELIRRAEGRWA